MLQELSDGDSLYVFKYGALGDVVRTAYVVTALAKKKLLNINWVTTPESAHLLRFNPYITSVIDKNSFVPTDCDAVLSLDDEVESISQAESMKAKSYFGTGLQSNEKIYTDTSSLWNDMGLLSRFGKEHADRLKRENKLGHSEIFSRMLGLDKALPVFFGNPLRELIYQKKYEAYDFVVGINPYAGKRWPSKEISTQELRSVILDLDEALKKHFARYLIVLYADDQNYQRAGVCLNLIENFTIENTSVSVLDFAASIKCCNLFVTADTLGMHLAISQKVPTVACFTATSSAEIDGNVYLRKICSLSDDYCSYFPSADNSSITASRIMEQVRDLEVFQKK